MDRLKCVILLDISEEYSRQRLIDQITYSNEICANNELDSINCRLTIFKNQTLPVCKAIENDEKLRVIDGELNCDEILLDIMELCDHMISNQLIKSKPHLTSNDSPENQLLTPINHRTRVYENRPSICSIPRIIPLYPDNGRMTNEYNCPIILLLGGPGSGRTEQAIALCEKLTDLAFFNVTDFLRKNILDFINENNVKDWDVIGRRVHSSDPPSNRSKPLPTLKDADFLTDLCKIHIGEESKKKVLNTLECDIQFLQENNLIDYSLLIGVHDPEIARNSLIEKAGGDDDEGTGGLGGGVLEPNSRGLDDRKVSSGDGLGTLASQWQSGRLSMARSSIVLGLSPDAAEASSCGVGVGVGTGNASTGDDDDEEEDGISIPENNAHQLPSSELTPPDSPPGVECLPQLFSGELHPTIEHYGIKSSIDSSHPLIYFVAIIDILTRYGMRKRTAQTYKTVKHGSDGGSVKPEFYGRRLLEFVEQCID
ncbi:unnamed protein product [Schistosoma turkestanicum]|nr:unnamed protein product [Schistosoma turkestanicum]